MDRAQMTKNFDLTSHNTMGLISRAEYGASILSVEDIKSLHNLAKSMNLPFHVIGGGSNLLPNEAVAAVVGIMSTKGREVLEGTSDYHYVKAAAGEDWSEFVEWTVAQGLGGLENLVGIPGTVGAAPIQNIGAYGLELQDRFHYLKAYDLESGEIITFGKEACHFSYRQSVFKKTIGRYVILEVAFALPKAWAPVRDYLGLNNLPHDATAADIMRYVRKIRSEKLPNWKELGNSGSFFHNPIVTKSVADSIPDAPKYPQPDGSIKLSAAWLIESCGFKGTRQGPVGVYDKHALILVNYGQAVLKDISRLAEKIQSQVSKVYGIELIQEPVQI
jgi:UDP-N-acetylmuramate dehydrogenase